MSSIDLFTMAIRNLFKRKVRTSLTILGVVIGTASIVIMISLGLAMNKTFEEQLANLGDLTVINVYNYGGGGGMMMGGGVMVSYGGSSNKKQIILDKNAISTMGKFPGVVAATPIMEYYITLSSGKFAAPYVNIMGIDPEAMGPLGYNVSEGRILNENDKFNIIFGTEVVRSYFFNPKKTQWPDPSKPINMEPLKTRLKASGDWRFYSEIMGYDQGEDNSNIPIKTYDAKVVGVLEPKGYPADGSIIMNINYLTKLKADIEKAQQALNSEYGWSQGTGNKRETGYQRALVKCTDLESVKKVKVMIEQMGFTAEIPSQSLDSMENIAKSLQSLLGAIGAVSFFVAALGIANTMITAIYERTREIGIMKVIGATLPDIKKLFLLESSLIGLFGGIFGVLISMLASNLMNSYNLRLFSSIQEFAMQTTVSLITPELCGMAVLFATLMGLFAGYLPADRAMRLSALSAIGAE